MSPRPVPHDVVALEDTHALPMTLTCSPHPSLSIPSLIFRIDGVLRSPEPLHRRVCVEHAVVTPILPGWIEADQEVRRVLGSLPTVGIGPGGSELPTPPGSSPPTTATTVHARPRFRPPWSTPTLTGHVYVLRVRLSSVSPSSRAPFPSLPPRCAADPVAGHRALPLTRARPGPRPDRPRGRPARASARPRTRPGTAGRSAPSGHCPA